MKFLLSILVLKIIFISVSNAQGDESKGIFKNLKVRGGFTITYSHQFTKNWVYILHTDSKFHLEKESADGGVPVSVVLLLPLEEEERFNFLLNISLLDLANSKNFFNSRIPFGFGGAYFFNEGKFPIGIALFCNIGKAYRMRQSAYDNPQVVFPIANYLGYNLTVGSPIPEEVIKPVCYSKTTYSLNGGLIIRL